MMKSIKYLFIIFFVGLEILAQAPNSKWKNVLELEDQNVFLDTSSIKKIESQITALSLSKFKSPVLVSSINKNVTSIKSQLLFDLATKKYTVIGTLFYDENWRILGESSLPGFSTKTSTFAVPIDSNKIMLSILAECESYINKNPNESVKNNGTIEKINLAEKENTQISVDTHKVADKRELLTEKFIDKKLNEELKFTAKPPEQNIVVQKNSVLPTIKTGEEKKLYGTIYSDGSKYYFQVSSWKNKAKAEEEALRLKKLGHNSFISEAYIANKGGTWYRVRIGYFNSLEETEQYMKRMN